MADQDSFPIGQAPWEQGESADPHPDSFPVGKAPWETGADSSPGILQTIGNGIEKYWSAPIRAAVGAFEKGQGPIAAMKAEDAQFGQDPSLAPSEADLGANLGLSRKQALVATADQQRAFDQSHNPNRVALENYQDQYASSPAEVGGKVLAAAADPLNSLPGGSEVEGGEALAKAAEGAGDALKTTAEHAMVNATGATGVQAAKFDENAGRYMLDNKVGTFGDSQKKIAQRAAQQMDQANSQISKSLQTLQGMGVTVKAQDIEDALNARIDALKADPSNADVIKRLQGEIGNLQATEKQEFGIADAENIKRGYNRKAGNWMDPESQVAGKETYGVWQQAVEDAATNADPQLANQFTKAKESYGILAPIQEAAQRRALAQSQKQTHLGLGDILLGEVAEKALGPAGYALPVVRHIAGPRLGSSVAVTLDKAGNAVKALPQTVGIASKAAPILPATAALTNAGAAIPAAASAPQKGPERWVADGANNLQQHAPNDPAVGAAAASDDPRVKDLLIKASDLRPGTKAMDATLNQIKGRIKQVQNSSDEGED